MKIDIKGAIVHNDIEEVYEWLDMECTSPRKVHTSLAEANGAPVEVEINSGGGYITAGSEIYAALKNYPGDVTIRVIYAASAASVIAMARHSIAEPTALIMIHNVSAYAEGDYRDMEREAEMLKTASRAMSAAYQEKTGKSEAEFLRLMDKETWFTAKEAHEYGLVDEIAEASAMVAAHSLPILSKASLDKALEEIEAYAAAKEKYKSLGGE